MLNDEVAWLDKKQRPQLNTAFTDSTDRLRDVKLRPERIIKLNC